MEEANAGGAEGQEEARAALREAMRGSGEGDSIRGSGEGIRRAPEADHEHVQEIPRLEATHRTVAKTRDVKLAKYIEHQDARRGPTGSAAQGAASGGEGRFLADGNGSGAAAVRQETAGPVAGSSTDAPQADVRMQVPARKAAGGPNGAEAQAAGSAFPQDHEEPQAKGNR